MKDIVQPIAKVLKVKVTVQPDGNKKVILVLILEDVV
jgi:hypothetical protein